MKRKTFFAWIAGGVAVFGMAAMGFHLLVDSTDFSEDFVIQDALSPDARLKAIVFSRSNVLTDGFSTQVSIVGASEHLSKEWGNVYIVNNDDTQPRARVRWNGNRSLTVEEDVPPGSPDVPEAEKQVRVRLDWFHSADVAIRYARYENKK